MFGHQDEPKNDNDGTAPVVSDNQGDSLTLPGAVSDTPSDSPATPAPSAPFPAPSTPSTPREAPSASPDALLDIKQQALQQLTPLVDHLEQSPEEKFRTTMMMIQAADNQDLIKNAYEAAQAITDEKARAQALLDIVNEINYFTQHSGK